MKGSGVISTGQAYPLLEVANMTPSQEEYRTIPLTQGQVAIVDAADYDLLSNWKWCAQWNDYTKSFYATRHYGVGNGNTRVVSMHRALLLLGQGETRQCDHWNGNTLDNRRSNLRIASHAENMRNRSMYKTNSTGFKGVTLRKSKSVNPWRADIQADNKRTCLGYFETPELAYAAYCYAARQLHGPFARI